MNDSAPTPQSSFPETVVGSDPDALDSRVTLPAAELEAGCYVEGDVPQKQTALMHNWCVQWAAAGHGFCYVHARRPSVRDLLARLPSHRLEDVVWIDFGRTHLAQSLDVPRLTRVGIDPFETPSRDGTDLQTEPVPARVSDCLDVFSTHSGYFDWNVATVWATLLPWLFADSDRSLHDFTKAMQLVALNEPLDRLLALGPPEQRPLAQRVIERAIATDADVLRTAAQVARVPLDPVPNNPLLGESTYAVGEALDHDQIVLVAGELPQENAERNEYSLLGTHLLVWTIVRRLWEASQRRGTRPRPFPLVIDRITELAPGMATCLRELLAAETDSPLAPILCGRSPKTMPETISFTVSDDVSTEVTFSEQASADVVRSLRSGDLAPVSRARSAEETGDIGDRPLCWVRTGQDFMLAGDPRKARQHHAAIPVAAPPRERPPEAVARAITQSVERHGQEATWLDEDMKAEVLSDEN